MAVHGDGILVVKGVSKRFSRTIRGKRRQLIRQFSRAVFGRPDDSESLAPDEFWALDDVSFELRRGEALGLVGLNGAGKSTLLSIIARQLLPDRGMVRSRGRIAAMVNLTAGFEDSLTGRENIFLKGALYGRSRGQILESFEDIVEFGEVNRFLDSPVGTYSSGMRMRLAFAVAIHTEPDLLLIDEVLSVGDFRFRQKCLGKLNTLRAAASFVFVSHSFQEMARFCNRLLVLDGGRLVFDGPTQLGLEYYQECACPAASDGRSDMSARPTTAASMGAPLALMGDFVHDGDALEGVSFEWLDETGAPVRSVRQDQGVVARVGFRLNGTAEGLAVGLPVWNIDGVMVTSVNSDVSGFEIRADSLGWVFFRVRFRSVELNPGTYFPILSIGRNAELIYRQPVAPLLVDGTHAVTWGIFTPRVHWLSESAGERRARNVGNSSDR